MCDKSHFEQLSLYFDQAVVLSMNSTQDVLRDFDSCSSCFFL